LHLLLLLVLLLLHLLLLLVLLLLQLLRVCCLLEFLLIRQLIRWHRRELWHSAPPPLLLLQEC
jgi:hypothetical protein